MMVVLNLISGLMIVNCFVNVYLVKLSNVCYVVFIIQVCSCLCVMWEEVSRIRFLLNGSSMESSR